MRDNPGFFPRFRDEVKHFPISRISFKTGKLETLVKPVCKRNLAESYKHTVSFEILLVAGNHDEIFKRKSLSIR